jgi:hypothetical protein
MIGESTNLRDQIVSLGAIPLISDLLDKSIPNTTFTRNASWALANICRGKPMVPANLIARAIPSLAKVLVENDNPEII